MSLSHDTRPSRVARLVYRGSLIFGVALATVSLLFVSLIPSVEVQNRPSTKDIQAARQVWRQLKSAQGRAGTHVRINDRMISGLSALARDGSGIQRFNMNLAQSEVRGAVSIELPFGTWLNASATATGSHQGFPPFRVTVGRLSLPATAGRSLAKLARWGLWAKGSEIPPLDEMVESFAVAEGHLHARVRLPSRTGVVDGVITMGSSAVDHGLVNEILCRISREQQTAPVQTISQLTRRTFAGASGFDPDAYARAAFAALSLAVVGGKAEFLLSHKRKEGREHCVFPGKPVQLQGRVDLAKHWALSAGLTAVLGREAAGKMGEWKELDDSRPGGSGFSFVDLAADRAGVQIATAALRPETAPVVQERLRGATEDYMLPRRHLKAPEGLSEAAFLQQFGSLDERNYLETILVIDALLAREAGQELKRRN